MKYKAVLFGILLIAAVLRLWQVGAIPISVDWDEASLGYNAYSILKTGRDEYGELFPLTIRSFGDYKPALYMYLAVPSIALFGLNDFAVRLPSALMGIAAVVSTYFFVKELFRLNSVKNQNKNIQLHIEDKKWVEITALLACFLLAISPWHIQFSRVAFEANTALTVNLLGALFLLKGLRHQYLLILSVLSFGLGLYVYQSEKLFIPLFGMLLILIFRKQLFAVNKKALFTSLVVGFLVVLPFIVSLAFDQNALNRARGVSVFTHSYPQVEETVMKMYENLQNRNVLGMVFDHRMVEFGKIIIGNYLSHFDSNWLFVTSDTIERHHAPNMGNLYIWELPFLLIGAYMLIFARFDKRVKYLIFGWIFITPIPAAVTWDVPNSVRTLNFLPTFQVLIALGILQSYLFFQKIRSANRMTSVISSVFAVGISFIAVGNFVYYINQYFSHYNLFSSEEWQYGYQDLINFSEKNKGKYDRVIVSNEAPLDQSYIFFLYYTKYAPGKYQQITTMNSHDKRQFDKYTFQSISYGDEEGRVLYIGRPHDFPQTATPMHIVRYLNGETAAVIVEK